MRSVTLSFRNIKSLAIYIIALVPFLAMQTAEADWPYTAGDWIFVSPSIGDLDGDGDLELVFGAWDGFLYCLDSEGNEVWKKPLADGSTFNVQLHSSPTLIDLDGNKSTLEIVVGSGLGSAWGKLYCLNADGTVLATFNTPTMVWAPPLVTDLENDGELDIVFGHVRYPGQPPASLFCVRVVREGGGVQLVQRWSVSYLDGSAFGAPAVADFNGDGVQEIVVSLGGTANTSSANSALYCFGADGQFLWRFLESGSFYYNTPAIADLDADNALDVVVAPFNGAVYCLNGLNGAVKWVFNHAGQSLEHSPAVADVVNNDGLLEIVIGSYGSSGSGNRLYCISHTGQQIWQHTFAEWTGFSCPGIADVDGDGDLEIAIGSDDNQGVPAGLYLFSHTGQVIWKRNMPNVVYSSPATADLDGDGAMEIAFGCYDSKFYVLDAAGQNFVSAAGSKPTDLAPWPTYRHNIARTGFKLRPQADINGDGNVNVQDMLAVINSWGVCTNPDDCPADVAPAPNGDDTVNVLDLLFVINNWG